MKNGEDRDFVLGRRVAFNSDLGYHIRFLVEEFDRRGRGFVLLYPCSRVDSQRRSPQKMIIARTFGTELFLCRDNLLAVRLHNARYILDSMKP